MDTPQTRYAKSGTVNIAYQVVGEGAIDLVFIPGFISHIDLYWALPGFPEFVEHLTSFSRLILFDKRGTGLSDPVTELPTLEQRMDDLLAVLDAVGSKHPALLGMSEGGPLSILFSATHPDRTAALILCGSCAAFPGWRGGRSVPWMTADEVEAWRQRGDDVLEHWGEGRSIDWFAPSLATGGRLRRRLLGTFERAAASPGMARAVMEAAGETDVRDLLPSVGAPTLVLHRDRDQAMPIGAGRWLADHIPGARWHELHGEDHIPWVGDSRALTDEIEAFLTGSRHDSGRRDRTLATILFTDIVGSTDRSASLGDQGWRGVVEQHNQLVRAQLERFRGIERKTLGDGFLATFDGPARAIDCARAIVEAVDELGIEIRAGLHTGEIDIVDGDIAGIAVSIGARVAALAGPGEVLVSQTVCDLVVGSGFSFEQHGIEILKGVPGEWRLYAVTPSPAIAVTVSQERPFGASDRAAVAVTRRAPRLTRRVVAAIFGPERRRVR
jgi:class 3 adenylate cyclase